MLNIILLQSREISRKFQISVELFDKHAEFGYVIPQSHLPAKNTFCKYPHERKLKGGYWERGLQTLKTRRSSFVSRLVNHNANA